MNRSAESVASRRAATRRLVRALVQVAVSMAVLGGIYFLVPTKSGGSSDAPWLWLELGLFAVVVALQVPAIVSSPYPVLRATVALGVVVPLYLFIFARVYLSSSLTDPTTFNEPLDHVTALYFTVTVFATVGFGDIVAKTDSMRLLVTLQMLVNLIVVGAGLRILVSAAQRGLQAKAERDPDEETGPESRPAAD